MEHDISAFFRREITRDKLYTLNKSSKNFRKRNYENRPPKLSKNDPIEKCMEIMTQLNVRYLPVVENETLIGLIFGTVFKKTFLDEVLLHQKMLP